MHGGDIHAGTQQRIYGADTDLADEGLRRDAKIVNFSIPMGTTEIGLIEQLKRVGSAAFRVEATAYAGLHQKTIKDAEIAIAKGVDPLGVIDLWEITRISKAKKAEASAVRLRLRSLGSQTLAPWSVLSPNRYIREEAFRQAQSFPMQAGNRGYFKLILALGCGEKSSGPWNRDGIDIQPLLGLPRRFDLRRVPARAGRRGLRHHRGHLQPQFR